MQWSGNSCPSQGFWLLLRFVYRFSSCLMFWHFFGRGVCFETILLCTKFWLNMTVIYHRFHTLSHFLLCLFIWAAVLLPFCLIFLRIRICLITFSVLWLLLVCSLLPLSFFPSLSFRIKKISISISLYIYRARYRYGCRHYQHLHITCCQ